MAGRFDFRYELDSIATGMRKDLQEQVGQTIQWWVYDNDDTNIDPIYDTGDPVLGGRVFFNPIYLPVLGAVKREGRTPLNDEGFYTVDSFTITFSADAAIKAGLGDIILRPDQHGVDRLIYENKVFFIEQVRVRGILTAGYTICAVDATQVKDEELVNDGPPWQKYISNTYTS